MVHILGIIFEGAGGRSDCSWKKVCGMRPSNETGISFELRLLGVLGEFV